MTVKSSITSPISAKVSTATTSINTNPYLTSTLMGSDTQGLNDLARVTGPELSDIGYMTVLNNTHEVGQLNPAKYMKYQFTEQARGIPAAMSFLKLQKPKAKSSWDVVNEALNDNGTFMSSIWYDTIGPAYFPLAYAAAAAAAPPNIKLYYNDYNIEYPGEKATAAQQLIASVKAQGIRIDGVGLEQNIAAFAAIVDEVAVTELDVRSPTLPPTLAQQQQQELDFHSTVAACVGTPACVGVTLWDFDNTYSWILSTFAGQGCGDPWFEPEGTDTYVKKNAYDGIMDALLGLDVTTT
ncbi:hypothetical protein MMC13_006146 [Lambiella insularis]|nr:hypothetical protein [Lambiella insularis]